MHVCIYVYTDMYAQVYMHTNLIYVCGRNTAV